MIKKPKKPPDYNRVKSNKKRPLVDMNKEKNNHEKLIQKKLIVQLVIEANAQFGSDGTPCVSFLC